MSVAFTVIAILAFLISIGLTAAMRVFALTHGVLDVPNARSSHARPTPRGGGVAIVTASTLATVALSALGIIPADMALALCGGLSVALVGFADDRFQVPAGVRLLVHAIAALWAMWWLGGLPPLGFGEQTVAFRWSGYLLGALGIIWTLNLFNFMDGTDGIAAFEATFIAGAAAVLALVTGTAHGETAAGIVFAAACSGFLLWNWPPAKIFMGDVGSGYIGYIIGVLSLFALRHSPAALWVWVILGGVFLVDATVTLGRRLLRGERIHVAHRSHAYQWLARRWGSHKRVLLAVILIDVAWLLPAALLAAHHSRWAAWIAAAALAPLVVLALAVGAGRAEEC